MNKTRLIAMGVAGAAALGAAFLANSFLQSPANKEVVEINKFATTPVLVALQEIRTGDVLSPSNVGWKDWPTDGVREFMVAQVGNEDFFEKEGDIRARANLFEGEPVNRKRLVEVGDAGFMAAVLPKGMRAISIRVSAETGAGGFILPNDRVDVILTLQMGGDDTVSYQSETILTDVRVLAIDQVIRQEEDREYVVASTATLELSTGQAELLAEGQATGELSLALRGLGDDRVDLVLARGGLELRAQVDLVG